MSNASKALPYEYVNEGEIDDELKCAICKQPFQSPVSLLFCQHTYCEDCITKWLDHIKTCPTCRRRISSDTTSSPYSEINTRIVLNQLDRILVRCLLCGQTNIQRGNYADHEDVCAEKIVTCPAADIKCTWSGKREEVTTHITDCQCMKLKPIIDDLKGEAQCNTYRLEGNLMTQRCTMPTNKCKYENIRKQYKCAICYELVTRDHISIHSCAGGCICQDCTQTRYPDYHAESSPSDDDDERN